MPTLIDDFTIGPDVFDCKPELDPMQRCQAGTMLGSGRRTSFAVRIDPRQQTAHLDINDTEGGFLNLSLGAEQFAVVEVDYGFKPDENGGCMMSPLDEASGDFASKGNRSTTKFHSANTLYPVNFNCAVFTATGWSSTGLNARGSPHEFVANFWFPGKGTVDNRRNVQFNKPGDTEPDFGRVAVV